MYLFIYLSKYSIAEQAIYIIKKAVFLRLSI